MQAPTVVNQFFNNLFGAIAGSNTGLGRQSSLVDFIPLDESGKTLNISGKGQDAVWLGLRLPIMQKYAYEYCFPVASVCDKLAEMDTNGKLAIIRAKGKGADDLATNEWSQKMNARLDQPNPLQTWEQFRGQQIVYKKVFGFCPVLPIIPAGYENRPEEASAIINIPPWLFEPIGTGKILYQTKIEDIIKEYRVTILNSSFVLKPSQIFILVDSFMQDDSKGLLVPRSRLAGLDFAVSNVCAAMEADNVILRRRGPNVIMSPVGKDGTGSLTSMTPTEREEAQNDLANYGITWSQFQYMITRNALQVQTVGFNVKELGTKDTVISGEKAICHRYNFPYTLYEETEATYANGSNAAQSVYTDNVIPSNLKDLNLYNKFFKAAENNCQITMDYEQLHVLQEDALNREHANYFQSQALDIQWKSGIITKNQWLQAQGYDTVTDGDVYFEPPQTKQLPPINKPAGINL